MILRRCYRPSVGLDIIRVCRPPRSIDKGQTIVRSPDIPGLLYGPVNGAVKKLDSHEQGPKNVNIVRHVPTKMPNLPKTSRVLFGKIPS